MLPVGGTLPSDPCPSRRGSAIRALVSRLLRRAELTALVSVKLALQPAAGSAA